MEKEKSVTDTTKQKMKDIQALVDRFLSWKLPETVCSDLCVTNRNYPHPRYGTNLLDNNEARQMIEYLLASPEVREVAPSVSADRAGTSITAGAAPDREPSFVTALRTTQQPGWSEEIIAYIDSLRAEKEAAEARMKHWEASYAGACVKMVEAGYKSFGYFDEPLTQLIRDRDMARAAFNDECERAEAAEQSLAEQRAEIERETIERCAKVCEIAWKNSSPNDDRLLSCARTIRAIGNTIKD